MFIISIILKTDKPETDDALIGQPAPHPTTVFPSLLLLDCSQSSILTVRSFISRRSHGKIGDCELSILLFTGFTAFDIAL